MATDITLSKGVRQNLLSLQGVADLLNRTQERLATGKKVNSALDNPINFFTSSGLSSRANDLSRLLDSVGNAVQTLEAADKGISSITKLIESAQATANQAKTAAAATTTYALDIAGNVDIGTDAAAEHTGNVDVSTPADLSAYDGETVTVTVNGVDTVINVSTGDDTDDLVADLNGVSGISASVDGVTGFIEITADNNTTTFELAFSAAGIATDSGLSAGTYGPTNAVLGALDGTVTVQVGSGPVYSLNFADATANEIVNRGELEARLAVINADLTDVALEIDSTTGFLEINSTSSESITVGETGGAAAALGVATGTTAPAATVTNSAARTSLQADFNLLLTQISELAADASFNGINLLDSDNLTVTFNEDGSSSLSISGVDFSASGLGLSTVVGTGFQADANIDAAIAELDTATDSLRTQASKFGSNLSIVQTRQDFTKNLVSVLQVGADNLVLADTNEEGANMLALNTRQQLSTVALSLASQADQNVLQLF